MGAAHPEIPIQNIYYLLCYAWNKLEESELVDVKPVGGDNLLGLLAKVLIRGTTLLLRKGLDRSFTRQVEELKGVRGKILTADTIKRQLIGRVSCEFDELSYDVPHNQILKATFSLLAGADDLAPELRESAAKLYRRLHGISVLPLNRDLFGQVSLHRNNQFYDFLIKICELIAENLLPSEEQGESKFRDFLRDEAKMAKLFEQFVRNFFREEQKVFQVGEPHIKWRFKGRNERAQDLLPKMRPDICLRSDSRTIIIDTKYYKEALQSYYDRQKLISGNMYQVFAYMGNLEVESDNIEGMLLYPTVTQELDEVYEDGGSTLRVRTVNLAQSWEGIKRELLGMVGD